MRIKLLRSTIVKGEAHEQGAVIDDVPEMEARLLIGMQKAILVDNLPAAIETADSEPPMETTAKPAPRRRKES